MVIVMNDIISLMKLNKLGKSLLIVFGGIIALLVVAFCGIYLFFIFLGYGMCGNTIFKTLHSPNNKYKAVVYAYDCGATTRYNFFVSIFDKQFEIKHMNQGNIYSDPNSISGQPDIFWNGNNSLTIIYTPSKSINKMEKTYKGISINYEIKE